jgi:hypothetical protein
MARILLSALMGCIVASGLVSVSFGEEKQPRLWKDSSGKFEVQAVLIDKNAAAVRLRTNDGREVSVPIERLSPADQEYLKSLNAPADNPFAGGKPAASPGAGKPGSSAAGLPKSLRDLPESKSAGETIALPGTGNTLDFSAAAAGIAFVPDPQPKTAVAPEAVVQLSAIDPYDKIAVPVVADGAEGRVLVSISRNKAGSPQETRGRIYSVSLNQKKSELVWDYPNAVHVMDHDAASGVTLVVDKTDMFERGGELVMLKGLMTGGAAPVYHRTLPGAGKPGFAPQASWAKLLSASHAAVIVDRVLYVWDMAAAQLLYRVESMSDNEPPVFSGSRRYMAIPQGGKVVIVETATGVVRRTITTGSSLTPGAAFDPTGSMLAVCFSNQFQVWDCVADKIVSEATTTEHLNSHPINWISPKLFLAASGDVIHLDLGMSVWKYNLSGTAAPYVLGNRLLSATTSQNCALTSIGIPHASAEKSVEQLMKAGDAAMLVRPGSSVAIAVETTQSVNQAEIKASLTQAAEKAGWKVSEHAPVTLVAKIGRGKTEELHFRSMGGGSRTESTASLTPFTADLEIRGGSNVLWTRSTVNHVPLMLQLKEGETVQDAVRRYEKPDAMFFSLLNLPPRIPKPEVSAKVGQSLLKDGKWQDLKPTPRSPRSK